MNLSALARIKQSIFSLGAWYLDTPERALQEAYDAALRIKRIEDEHFDGQKITINAAHSKNVSNYFQAELKKNLKIARMRLTEFKASNRFIDTSRPNPLAADTPQPLNPQDNQNYSRSYTLEAAQYSAEVETRDRGAAILAKLRFVDEILNRYQTQAAAPPPLAVSANGGMANQNRPSGNNSAPVNTDSFYESEFTSDDLTGGSFIPRSILRTANRFKKELEPGMDTEEEIVRDFRLSRARTRMAIKFILLLIIIPLLTQQISKNFIFSPIVDRFRPAEQIEMAINIEIEERVLAELDEFESRLRFQSLTGQIPATPAEIESRLRDKALELSQKYQWAAREPVKNIFADALSLGVFAFLIATGQKQIAVLKSFIDEVIYGLSDSAKAFIIILFTDVFVGFHSPHGWEVIISTALQHFGLPENQDFINMFIATFPVMLDTVFKYWIFRYLNQISPSAVATYRNMNE